MDALGTLEAKLVELGFAPMQMLNAEERARKQMLRERLTAAEGAPRIDPKEPGPQFFFAYGKTFALAENDSKWTRAGEIDLSTYGFCDVTEQMRDIVRKIIT